MKELTIYHKKRHRNIWLLLGGSMFLLGLIANFFNESDLGFNLGIGIMYFGMGIYYTFRPYIKVKDDFLWVSSSPFRKVNLNEVEKVKQFIDETTIISNGKETLITNLQMSDADKEKFIEFVEGLQRNAKASIAA
jgi:hypothetical protein